jgi:hypothetical protein
MGLRLELGTGLLIPSCETHFLEILLAFVALNIIVTYPGIICAFKETTQDSLEDVGLLFRELILVDLAHNLNMEVELEGKMEKDDNKSPEVQQLKVCPYFKAMNRWEASKFVRFLFSCGTK